jgi:hypothetical protein
MEPEIKQRHGGKYMDNAEAGIKSLTADGMQPWTVQRL